jgi:adenylate cyclase
LLRATPESLAKAKEYCERALAIEPNYAPAYTWLAGYYFLLSYIGIKTTGEVTPLAKSAVEKALAIDPDNPEAHSWLAVMAGVVDYDWKAAETHHRRAIATEPVQPLMRNSYAIYYLVPCGRFPEAIEQCRLALESDPLSMVLHTGMVLSMYCAGQHREAVEWARRAMEIDASFYGLWLEMGLAQLQIGCAKEAITSFQRVVELAPAQPGVVSETRWLALLRRRYLLRRSRPSGRDV